MRILRSIVLTVIICMIGPLSAFAYGPDEPWLPVFVNGDLVSRAVFENGKTYLPIREIGMIDGITASWNNTTKTATISSSAKSVQIKAKDGRNLAGRYYAPLAAIRQLDGVAVSYNSATRTVEITTKTIASVDATRTFVREPLPVIYEGNPEYRDKAPNMTSGVYSNFSNVPLEKHALYGFPTDHLKGLVYPDPAYQDTITVREMMRIYVIGAELNPNSDPRNIPINIQVGTDDYALWQKAAKTGIFQFLVRDDGTVNMNRAITWPEFARIWSLHYDWMGANVYDLKPQALTDRITMDFGPYKGPYLEELKELCHIGVIIPYSDYTDDYLHRVVYSDLETRIITRFGLYMTLEHFTSNFLI